jgi:hypothetical protein
VTSVQAQRVIGWKRIKPNSLGASVAVAVGFAETMLRDSLLFTLTPPPFTLRYCPLSNPYPGPSAVSSLSRSCRLRWGRETDARVTSELAAFRSLSSTSTRIKSRAKNLRESRRLCREPSVAAVSTTTYSLAEPRVIICKCKRSSETMGRSPDGVPLLIAFLTL